MENASSSSSQPQPQKRKRVERGRSKNGCLTCLTKKVKCDETRPQCNRCVRLRLECRWATQMQPLAERRRGLGPIKQREKWTPQTIVPKTDDAVSEGSQSVTPPALTPAEELQLAEGLPADMSFDVLPVGNEAASASPTNFPDIPPEDMINPITIPQYPHDSSQLILYPTPSFDLLSLFPSFSFTNPTEPAPSIGSDDVQAMTFHSTVLAPMKSTRKAALSAHSIFLNFAVQNPMALHFLLAFSHSELAIHHGFSHRPPLESYLHFQNGSQLLSQALVTLSPTNHIAMMLSFLYLYMFWMRRDPLEVERLRELSISILAYVTMFSLDEVCANSGGNTGTSEPVTLSRILTYIYDRDVFCGFFGCGAAFAGYVSQKHETRQRIWLLSRMPILPDQTETWFRSESLPETSQRRILDVYFSLITIQYEINVYSQSSELAILGKGLEIRNKLDKIREEQNFLFTLSRDCAQQSTQPPLMALVAVTIFHALEIYLHRSRDTFFGETPVPADIERALQELVSAAYHTIPVGPVQLLERFQWALLIGGIETHDPVYRDWISASISDPVIKGVYDLVVSAKTLSAKGISMEAVRELVSKQSTAS
ncbi:hypothetical protein IWW34DRAFT_822766 [Fusarium oxysporum f. sp. albedinis]|nr:hypothetical protein IWW34DRAFT_822766 [Fusarium oxysporum f. sp. albedinis]KAJ0153958.1 Uncharacterized protein HZ326_3727 [Fusarium oxysporum f. sp. albedinis]KAK2480650.1 hypothetical protein H9L39_06289 [Fusarium oxysporum f. sp. albedinis]